MRSRSKGSVSLTQCKVVDLPGPTSSYTNERVASGSRKTIVDEVTPDFQIRKSRGEIVMKPYTLSSVSATCESGAVTFTSAGPGWGARRWEGHWASFLAAPAATPSDLATWLARAKAQTLLEAYADVAKSSAQALVTVAEFRQTMGMLASPFKAANDLINRIAARRDRYLRRGDARRAAKAFADSWAEYRFGWKPLLFDIENIMKAYATRRSSQRMVKTRETARKTQLREFVVPNLLTGTGYGLASWSSHGSSTWSLKVSSGVIYDIKDKNAGDSLNRQFGLRLSDVPLALWELIPLSFVLDRFYTVGAWIEAITPKPGVTVLGNWTTVVQTVMNVSHSSGYIVVNDGGITTSGTPDFGTWSSSDVTVSREVNLTPPLTPVISNRDITVVQTVDHLALIMQRLLNLRR